MHSTVTTAERLIHTTVYKKNNTIPQKTRIRLLLCSFASHTPMRLEINENMALRYVRETANPLTHPAPNQPTQMCIAHKRAKSILLRINCMHMVVQQVDDVPCYFLGADSICSSVVLSCSLVRLSWSTSALCFFSSAARLVLTSKGCRADKHGGGARWGKRGAMMLTTSFSNGASYMFYRSFSPRSHALNAAALVS